MLTLVPNLASQRGRYSISRLVLFIRFFSILPTLELVLFWINFEVSLVSLGGMAELWVSTLAYCQWLKHCYHAVSTMHNICIVFVKVGRIWYERCEQRFDTSQSGDMATQVRQSCDWRPQRFLTQISQYVSPKASFRLERTVHNTRGKTTPEILKDKQEIWKNNFMLFKYLERPDTHQNDNNNISCGHTQPLQRHLFENIAWRLTPKRDEE